MRVQTCRASHPPSPVKQLQQNYAFKFSEKSIPVSLQIHLFTIIALCVQFLQMRAPRIKSTRHTSQSLPDRLAILYCLPRSLSCFGSGWQGDATIPLDLLMLSHGGQECSMTPNSLHSTRYLSKRVLDRCLTTYCWGRTGENMNCCKSRLTYRKKSNWSEFLKNRSLNSKRTMNIWRPWAFGCQHDYIHGKALLISRSDKL